jgi:hypothetical protein
MLKLPKVLKLIEVLSDLDNFLKVPLRGTFKKLSVFYGSYAVKPKDISLATERKPRALPVYRVSGGM